MVDEATRVCRSCGKPLEKEMTDDPETYDDLEESDKPLGLESWWCVTQGCPLKGGTQPHEKGARTMSGGGNSATRNYRVGRVSQKEGNVSAVIARLVASLPARFRIRRVDEEDHPADIEIVCDGCGEATGGQVKRSVAEESAAQSGKTGAAWGTEHADEFTDRVKNTISRKTEGYAPDVMQSMLLIIDVCEDLFWPVPASTRSAIEEAVKNSPWHGVLLIEVDEIEWAKGGSPRCTCSPSTT